MDSVQVRKAVFVKESYTTLGADLGTRGQRYGRQIGAALVRGASRAKLKLTEVVGETKDKLRQVEVSKPGGA